ncbi:MAG: ABC transporter ATP-binding protein [Proteobacteria bacterium]|nr:ABC transporter ATP-binding protein [Pseudomonadota bacterium]MBU1740653.1 ABC transporter ATP-binding protein [Pseudomonadota bacterium]
MLEVKNIDVAYGDVQVLWDASFTVKEGEILVLVGANGAGKSTTLKTISSLLPLRSGEIHFLGERLDNLPPHVVIEEGVVQVPEGRRLFPEMTVEENLIMGSLSHSAKPKRRESLDWVYSLFPRLLERRKQPAGTLSGGEQQMVAVGRGLMARPKLLMFDEPSLGLAPLLVEDIFNIVRKIHEEGVTTLLVEQNVNLTLQFCDRAYVMENGRIALTGSGQELLHNDHVRQAYLGI